MASTSPVMFDLMNTCFRFSSLPISLHPPAIPIHLPLSHTFPRSPSFRLPHHQTHHPLSLTLLSSYDHPPLYLLIIMQVQGLQHRRCLCLRLLQLLSIQHGHPTLPLHQNHLPCLHQVWTSVLICPIILFRSNHPLFRPLLLQHSDNTPWCCVPDITGLPTSLQSLLLPHNLQLHG